jgi:hypothetical protein
LLQSTLGLACEQRHPMCLGALKIGVAAFEHAERAGNMKATDRN